MRAAQIEIAIFEARNLRRQILRTRTSSSTAVFASFKIKFVDVNFDVAGREVFVGVFVRAKTSPLTATTNSPRKFSLCVRFLPVLR
jgi:hypothetical protein